MIVVCRGDGGKMVVGWQLLYYSGTFKRICKVCALYSPVPQQQKWFGGYVCVFEVKKSYWNENHLYGTLPLDFTMVFLFMRSWIPKGKELPGRSFLFIFQVAAIISFIWRCHFHNAAISQSVQGYIPENTDLQAVQKH